MSAWIVGHDHIDALLTFATNKPRNWGVCYRIPGGESNEIDERNATEIGRILMAECERSVQARYPNDSLEELPGTIGERSHNYKFKRWAGTLSPIAILKACDCYDYQACETDDYQETLACLIIEAIRNRAISVLPGYDEAPGWQFERS